MLIPARRHLRRSKKSRNKAKERSKSWIVLDGEVVLRGVTVDGDRAFVHPERHYLSQHRSSMKKTARIIDPAHIFRTKNAAVRSLKPKPVWWLRYGKICSGRVALARSPSDGGTVTRVYNLAGDLVSYQGELYHSRRSAALGAMAYSKKRMILTEREYNRARREYVRVSQLAKKEIEKEGGR